MRIIITENQNFILRRLTRFIEIVEEQIEWHESQDDNPWWCSAVYNPDIFVDVLIERCINILIEEDWDSYRNNTDRRGTNMDFSVLNKIVEESYGNYVRNLYVRKCGRNKF